MQGSGHASRRIQPGDPIFAVFLLAYAWISVALIPYDFTDLFYLFSLEHGPWGTQEWVHPIYVPVLRLLAGFLGCFGYHGHMLVPAELLNVAAATIAYAVLYRLARRSPGSSLAAAVALALAATCIGFWSATVRPTPYALAFLLQTLAVSLLLSEPPVLPGRYALAGGLSGLAMGFHTAAMALGVLAVASALFEPDRARARHATFNRVCAFAGGMAFTAAVCWTVFLLYNAIGADYFRNLDFRDTLAGVEQVPGRSIYSNDSAVAQVSQFVGTLTYQVGPLLLAAMVGVVCTWLVRRRQHATLTPYERRLTVCTAANFAAFAGFFVINGSYNGFIFASMTVVPVLLANLARDSLVGLGALILVVFLSAGANVSRMTSAGWHGANDSQLAEVHFLRTLLGPHDVLLTPGSPFPEMLYLAHFNVAEVSLGDAAHWGTEVPVLHPGGPLSGRVAWWLSHGSRVFYAFGDTTTDFAGDVGGAEKEHQIFWRPETVARERAPELQRIRAALEASGILVREGPTSPQGKHYGEIVLHPQAARPAPSPSLPPPLAPEELRAIFLTGDRLDDDPMLARRAEFLGELAAAIPGDPWLTCDVMSLICKGGPRRDGTLVSCEPVAGCDDTVGVPHWGRANLQTGDRADATLRGRSTGRHLTPAVSRVLQDVAGRSLPPLLRGAFTVFRLDVGGDAIELAIQDRNANAYAITLALSEVARSDPPDGRGRTFLFYLSAPQGPANAAATEALLAAASLFDQAVTDDAPIGLQPSDHHSP